MDEWLAFTGMNKFCMRLLRDTILPFVCPVQSQSIPSWKGTKHSVLFAFVGPYCVPLLLCLLFKKSFGGANAVNLN